MVSLFCTHSHINVFLFFFFHNKYRSLFFVKGACYVGIKKE